MKTLSRESKEKIFLGLTRFHRDITNNINTTLYKSFASVGYTNDAMIRDIKDALLRMRVISVKDHKYIWNSEKTLPNPQLVEGIILTIKEMRKQYKEKSEEIKVKVNVTPKEPVKEEPIKIEENSIENILKSILKAGVNPTIVIICNK